MYISGILGFIGEKTKIFWGPRILAHKKLINIIWSKKSIIFLKLVFNVVFYQKLYILFFILSVLLRMTSIWKFSNINFLQFFKGFYYS